MILRSCFWCAFFASEKKLLFVAFLKGAQLGNGKERNGKNDE